MAEKKHLYSIGYIIRNSKPQSHCGNHSSKELQVDVIVVNYKHVC